MTEWERTGDSRWRDRILAGVDSIIAMPYWLQTGQLNGLNDKIDSTLVGPPGPQGVKGDKGDGGDKGDQGDAGPQGPPFAGAVVDGVTTLDPGQNATVATSFDGANVHFSFGIPRGDEGPQGQPGEVTQAALDATIAGTARNPTAIGPYGGDFSEPPTQQEMRDFRDYVETLRVAVVR